MTQCYNNMGECYVKTKEYDKALESVDKGLKLSREISAPEQIIHAYQVFSIIYSAKEDFKNAFLFKELDTAMKDSISAAENKRQIAEMQVRFDTEKKESENKLLQQENEIQALTITNNRYLLMGLGGLLLLIILSGILIVKQNRTRSEQRALQMEQKMLRSQMNPHFIFNSLTAIESYIYKNEPKEAGKYLS